MLCAVSAVRQVFAHDLKLAVVLSAAAARTELLKLAEQAGLPPEAIVITSRPDYGAAVLLNPSLAEGSASSCSTPWPPDSR